MAHLALSFLGGFQVLVDGHPVMEFKSNKVRALLAYLAVEADRPHRREALAGLLWPERTDHDALSNLRYTLANLRSAIGEKTAAVPSLLITHHTIQFNQASDSWLDAAEFDRHMANARTQEATAAGVDHLKAAIELYRGALLEGFSVSGAAPFEEWVLLRREQIARQVMTGLARLAAYSEARGEHGEAQGYARRQVALEPWDEAAHRSLMRTLALDGQRTAALHQFEICRRTLQDELGVEPAEETVTLHEAIRAGRSVGNEARRQVENEAAKPGHRATGQHPGAGPERLRWQRDRMNILPQMAIPGLAGSSDSPVVAREVQLARLQGSLAQALAGAGHVIFVSGEAGSGKTVLMREFARRAMQARPELLVAAGACDAAGGIGDPYLPFREILQLLTGDIEAKRAGATLAPEHARRLWAAIPDALQALVEEGPGLIDTFVPGSGLALRADAFIGEAQRSRWHGRLEQVLRAKRANRSSARLSLQSVQQSDLFEQVNRVLQGLARRHPLCLVLDDLQWADAGSISLLFHLGRRISTSRILIVAGFRSDAIAAQSEAERHSLQMVVNELERISGQEPIDLDACEGREFVTALLYAEPNRLSPDFGEMLFRQTEGHPLFTVELLHSLEERGDLVRDPKGRWTEGLAIHWDKLPLRVEAAIAERIGRLPDKCRTLLATASVDGEEFTAEAVARALDTDERSIIQCLSGDLIERHGLVRAVSLRRLGAHKLSRYRFRHRLFQQYLYDHLDTVRRAHLHEAIGNALELLHEEEPEELNVLAPRLAWHFEQAGLADRAAGYHLRAGNQAARLFAYEEAITHLARGLALLDALPETAERARLKLDLHLAAVYPLAMARGFWAPERLEALERAHQLSHHPALGGSQERLDVLAAMAYFALMAAQTARAVEIGEQVLRQAEQNQDHQHSTLAQSLLGFAHSMRLELAQAREHLDQALAGYERRGAARVNLMLGIQVDAMSLCLQAATLWQLGYPDQASQRLEEALAAATDSGHAGTLGFVQSAGSLLLFLLSQDPEAARQQVEALRGVSEKGLPLAAWAGSLSNWGPDGDGQADTLLQHMRRRDETFQAVGTGLGRGAQLLVLAQSYALAGQVNAGLDILDEALSWIDRSGVFYLEAEVHRLRGDLMLRGQPLEEETGRAAEACYREAIAIARRQGARWWELRATSSLCRLLRKQGTAQPERLAEARRMLAETYGQFSEGFDTRDMQEARMLLEELQASAS